MWQHSSESHTYSLWHDFSFSDLEDGFMNEHNTEKPFPLRWSTCSRNRNPYLESVAGEAQAQLPAHHHGLHGSPALTAHSAPHQRAVPLRQHLHAALVRVTATA